MINKLVPIKRYLVIFSIALFYSCSQVKPPEPVLPLPSDRQLAWHELEYYAFVHFNMNTFSNMEWGLGDENPALFNPTELDCRQWAQVCKDAGMKGIIITAKHHDGFCLWPSEYTEHSVKNSPWKDGKGDVVRELADACKEYGLKFGVYLSPWDRNHADYGKPEYITYFKNQLRELLSNYGDVFEVWFDGANGGDGWYGGANEIRKIDNKTYYEWESVHEIVRELQPDACMFSDAGPDIRWCGNEQGWVRETNWSLLNIDSVAPGVVPDIEWLRAGQENGSDWIPAEVDVSIRPGWYYHPSEDHKVKTLPELLDIYYHSVGRNASLLINLPVDTRGLVHETDVEQILKLAGVIKTDFSHNLLEGLAVSATNTRGNSSSFKADNVIDSDPESYWATDDGVKTASLAFDLGKSIEFNRFLIQENIRLGQRVKSFSLEAFIDDEWQEIAKETTIGRKRILRFPNVTASKLRLTILDSKACPTISNVGIYLAPKVIVEPQIRRNKAGMVTIQGFDNGLEMYYTLDGTNPTTQSLKYSEPFLLNQKATVKAIVVDATTSGQSLIAASNFDVSKNNWKISGKLESPEASEFMFDGDPETAWTLNAKAPVDFIVDLGEKMEIEGFTYLPNQRRGNPGIIYKYEFYVSGDGNHWGSPVSQGEFSNIKNNPVLQEKKFKAVSAKYVKLRAISTTEENARVGIAEFGIITP